MTESELVGEIDKGVGRDLRLGNNQVPRQKA